MARVSMKHEDAMQMGFFQEGNVEVLKSVCAIHQFPPNSKTGTQSDPFTCVRWTVQKLDQDWKPVEGEQEVITIRLGAPQYLRPGQLSKPDDLNELPDDLGTEVDTEGNSVYGEEGAKVGGNWPAMEESLRKCGFKPSVIERCCMTDYTGMKAHLKTIAAGRKYKDKTTGEEKEATELVADKIHTYPYEVKKAGKGAGAGAGATGGKVAGKVEATGKTVTAPATETAVATGTANGAALETAKTVLTDPSDRFKKQVPPGQSVKRNVFQMQVMQELMLKKVPANQHKGVVELIKNDDSLVELAGEVGFVVDFDEGTVTFPEAG